MIDLDEFFPPEPELCDICRKPLVRNTGPGRPRKRHAGNCEAIERMRLRAQREARKAARLAREAAAA